MNSAGPGPPFRARVLPHPFTYLSQFPIIKRKSAGGLLASAARVALAERKARLMATAPVQYPELDRWKFRLRVRLASARGAVPAGAEGVVVEFLSAMGEDHWQVEFPSYGVLNIERCDLAVLDNTFRHPKEDAKREPLTNVLAKATRAALYITYPKFFKELKVWSEDGECVTVYRAKEAQMLLRLLRERNIPVASEICT